MHFQSKLHNNSVLTGSVDSYCLVCDNYLRSEDEAIAHIEKPIHKKKMGLVSTVEKFLDDHIIKVKKGYYCPFCNMLLTTTTKVTIHISDTNHKENKGAQVLTRTGNNIIAFDEVVITLESWHGLIDNTCVICNTEFEDNMHRTDEGHVLKLVQSKCEFGDKYIYRKVDEDSFHCLICASVFSINEKLDHHENNSHKNYYDSGKKLKYNIPPNVEETKSTLDLAKTPNVHKTKPVGDRLDLKNTESTFDRNEKTKSTHPMSTTDFRSTEGKIRIKLSKDEETITLFQNSAIACNVIEKPGTIDNEKITNASVDTKEQVDILDRVDEFQRKGINIDFTWERARCKHCAQDIPFNTAAIVRHINDKHNSQKKINSAEPKLHLQEQKKTNNFNDITPCTTKIDIKMEEKKIENIAEPTDITKLANIAEQKLDSKKEHKKSESFNDVKTDKKKPENVEQKEKKKQQKKSEKSDETCIKKNNNSTEPNIDLTNQKKSDGAPQRDATKELEILAKENNIVVKPNEAYCPQCKVVILLNISAINVHVNSNSHKYKNTGQNCRIGKRVQAECVKSFILIESSLGSDVILNNKYVLRHHSYHCIVMEDDSYKCMLCEVYFSKTGELTSHMNGPEHKNKLGLCRIFCFMPEEFVREIAPDIHHCGYCNVVVESWTEMQDHLSHSMHLYARRHAQWNLERCHSVIRNTKLMQISNMHAINYA